MTDRPMGGNKEGSVKEVTLSNNADNNKVFVYTVAGGWRR